MRQINQQLLFDMLCPLAWFIKLGVKQLKH